MSDSFAPTALFLSCNHLYHKLRASDEALACGYRGVAAMPRLRVGGSAGWRPRSAGDESDNSEARHGAQVCKLRSDHKRNSSARRVQVTKPAFRTLSVTGANKQQCGGTALSEQSRRIVVVSSINDCVCVCFSVFCQPSRASLSEHSYTSVPDHQRPVQPRRWVP